MFYSSLIFFGFGADFMSEVFFLWISFLEILFLEILFPEKLFKEILCIFPSILECPVNAFLGLVSFSVVYDGLCLKCLTLLLF